MSLANNNGPDQHAQHATYLNIFFGDIDYSFKRQRGPCSSCANADFGLHYPEIAYGPFSFFVHYIIFSGSANK